METTFLFPPAKRNLQYITTTAAAMPEPVPNKRFKTQQQPGPPPVPAGYVSFRLLCHESRIGGLIGKSGSIIKQIQQDTGAKIRIEDAPRDCTDRVVSIIAPKGVDSKINLGDGEEIEVSKGQGALVRVFERILEVAAESDGAGVVAAGGVVSCRMLAEASQVGSVIGKGGKVVEKIRKDCGVKIRVLTDKLPACASATEEIVEIEGDVLAVEKALIAVSHRLQDGQPVGKTRITGGNPVEPVHQEYFPELPSSILSQCNSVLSSLPIESISYASRHPFSLESERVSAAEMKIPQQEVVFKVLCSNDRVGGIIGRGGSIVKAIQNETGATISVGATAAECDERLITITSMENPENRYSAAQRTVVLLFSRSVEAGFEKGYKGSSVNARLVVSPSQVGCLLGKGGCIISEMRRETGAGIKILGADQVPKCVQQNDQLIQISGDLVKVKDAIYHVTGRLRDNLFSTLLNAPVSVLNETRAYGTSAYGGLGDALQEASRDLLRDPIRNVLRDPVRDSLRDPLRDAFGEPLGDRFREPLRDPVSLAFHSSVGVSSGLNRHATTLTQRIDHLGRPSSLDRLSPPRLWASQRINEINERSIADASRGLSSLKTGLGHVSGSKSVTVTNTTLEIVVPEDVIGFVYGENGRNLARLKEISGAKVIVHEPRLGTSDRIVVISGTPDETQAAQSLLQAFILTGT